VIPSAARSTSGSIGSVSYRASSLNSTIARSSSHLAPSASAYFPRPSRLRTRSSACTKRA
jgi:hypothetical protein